MLISTAFPAKYVKAADLKGRKIKVKMGMVVSEEVGSEAKPILYFQGTDKGLVLNRTNADLISVLYGDDTERWRGQEIVLYPARTQFQGRMVDCIRIESANAAQPIGAAAQAAVDPLNTPQTPLEQQKSESYSVNTPQTPAPPTNPAAPGGPLSADGLDPDDLIPF